MACFVPWIMAHGLWHVRRAHSIVGAFLPWDMERPREASHKRSSLPCRKKEAMPSYVYSDRLDFLWCDGWSDCSGIDAGERPRWISGHDGTGHWRIIRGWARGANDGLLRTSSTGGMAHVDWWRHAVAVVVSQIRESSGQLTAQCQELPHAEPRSGGAAEPRRRCLP